MVAPDLHDNTPVLSETIAYKHWMDPAFAMHQGLSLLVIGQHTGPTHLRQWPCLPRQWRGPGQRHHGQGFFHTRQREWVVHQ